VCLDYQGKAQGTWAIVSFSGNGRLARFSLRVTGDVFHHQEVHILLRIEVVNARSANLPKARSSRWVRN